MHSTAIIANGHSDYQILTPARPSPAQLFAAETLQRALHRMTGVRLPVRDTSQRVPGRPAILLGTENAGALPGLWDKDAYRITTRGDDLLLTGSSDRAVHYAVNAFLEMQGARFFGPEVSTYPHRARVSLPARPLRSTAAFGYRHVFYPNAQEPEWALRWNLNVHHGRDLRWGANAVAHSFGHSFSALVPLEEHFCAHPEYFSLVDGRRRDTQQQLCCTNPAVVDVASETLARWIAAHSDRRIFAVGMNDWNGWCECPQCARADRRAGSPTGQLLTLVNRVAERFPDRIIATLAYAWAIEPPRDMVARENVLIVLCHNAGCFTHPLTACAQNRVFLQRLRGWQRKAQHILIWDYFVNYHSYLMPTPNLARIEQDLRMYRDLGVAGMFCQGSACRGGQFEGLRQYLLARFLWNPDRDIWVETDKWLRGVYGAGAGGNILDYLQLLHRHVAKNKVHMHAFGSGQEINHALFTPAILQRGQLLWDKAEKAATSPELRRRVFAARAPEMCARLFHAGINYRVEHGKLAPHPAPDHALKNRFVRAAVQGGAAHLRENAGAPEEFARTYGRAYTAAVLESPQLRAVVMPELGGRLYSLWWRPDAVELLRVIDMTRFVNYFPYDAGYEFSTEPHWHGNGANAEYTILQQTVTHVRLQADLPGRLRLETVYALDGAGLAIRHCVTNRGRQPVSVAPCTHPEWNLATFGDDAFLELRAADGTWRRQLLNPEGRRDRDLEFASQDMPRGAWRVAARQQGLMLEETFAAKDVRRCRVLFSRDRGNLNLELHFKPRAIAPGASANFATHWRIHAPGPPQINR